MRDWVWFGLVLWVGWGRRLSFERETRTHIIFFFFQTKQDTANRVLVLERWGGGLVRGDGWGLRTLTTGTALYVEGSVRLCFWCLSCV